MTDAEIFQVKYIAPDGTEQARQHQTQFGVTLTTRRQWDAAEAAAEVQRQGGDFNQQLNAAKGAYFKMNETPIGPKPVFPSDANIPEGGIEEEMIRRYLLAVARLTSGKFDDLPTRDLMDICLLTKAPVAGMDEWSGSLRQLSELVSKQKG